MICWVLCRQYHYYWSVGCGVCGVFCLYAEESRRRDYGGEEARLSCERERDGLEVGVGVGLVGLGGKEKERVHGCLYNIVRI